MKILLMGTHIDGLKMPSGVERHPCGHEWKAGSERTETDPLGRPYCNKCGGMPMWYDLEEIDLDLDKNFKYAMSKVTSGLAIVID